MKKNKLPLYQLSDEGRGLLAKLRERTGHYTERLTLEWLLRAMWAKQERVRLANEAEAKGEEVAEPSMANYEPFPSPSENREELPAIVRFIRKQALVYGTNNPHWEAALEQIADELELNNHRGPS